jgi:hypothetical protein
LEHGWLEEEGPLTETQTIFKDLMANAELQAFLVSVNDTFDYHKNQIKTGLSNLRTHFKSIKATRTSDVSIVDHIIDILHWQINIANHLVEFCERAASQVGALKALEARQEQLVGRDGVQGLDGIQAIELLRAFEEWLEPLAEHPQYGPIR